ncbi:GNAT family N-acetyltransferase [Enterococcus ureilyticus]|uniref:GNAT family N-acetyltransferase n=1 Tax=Enterococcus ureilyticus TaxID=1131292 RepID=UPI001A932703|nr:GNAT family N-acetyltransferase [Enterococcus ureilyticus]MBO0447898.1 GNAT family N-acetyltransferase [Enterococcus ureilyticus]
MVKIINWNSEAYWAGVQLRNELLKSSAGKEWIKELPLNEEKDIHMTAMIEGNVVGTLILSKKSRTIGQIKQVAINEAHQGFGIGKKLLEFAEKVAELMGCQIIILNGRMQAWGFYEHFGYQSIGQAYNDGNVVLKTFEKRIYTNKKIESFKFIRYITLKEMETNG